MVSALVAVLLAFPPMTAPQNLPAHHLGSPTPRHAEAAVASLGGVPWIFWVDSRRDRSFDVPAEAARDDLWAVPLDANGDPREDAARVGCLAPPGGTFEKPRAVAVDGAVLVVWVQRNQANGAPLLRVARLRTDGTLVCRELPLPTPEDLRDFDLGFSSGRGLLVVTTPAEVKAVAVTVDGFSVDGGSATLGTPGTSSRPSITAIDGGLLVGWVDLQGRALVINPADATAMTPPSGVTRLALATTTTGPVAGTLSSGTLKVYALTETGGFTSNSAIALTGIDDFLLQPVAPQGSVALGWTTAGQASANLVTPGTASPMPSPFPAGHRPLALGVLPRGAVTVTEVLDPRQRPLATLSAPLTTNGQLAWDGGALVTLERNQARPSVAWAGAVWLAAYDEANEPFDPRPATHATFLTKRGALQVGPELLLPASSYRGLVAGDGRVAGVGSSETASELYALQVASGGVSVGNSVAVAAPALRHAALGDPDVLQWSDSNSGSFTALHTIPAVANVPLTHSGVPGRCAARVGKKFYLPVWQGTSLKLLVFDGASLTAPEFTTVDSFPLGAESTCAAANGDRVLIAWSTSAGLSAVVFETTTGSVTRVVPPGDSGDQAPVVAASADGWVMVWEASMEANPLSDRRELRGTTISREGVAALPAAQVGLGTRFTERSPVLASAPTGQVALAWSAFDLNTGLTTAMVRVIGEVPVTVLPDGGLVDGGQLEPDGGAVTPDGGASQPDGGLDSNLVTFDSCGCTTASPATLLLAALALCRWRPRRPASSARASS